MKYQETQITKIADKFYAVLQDGYDREDCRRMAETFCRKMGEAVEAVGKECGLSHVTDMGGMLEAMAKAFMDEKFYF